MKQVQLKDIFLSTKKDEDGPHFDSRRKVIKKGVDSTTYSTPQNLKQLENQHKHEIIELNTEVISQSKYGKSKQPSKSKLCKGKGNDKRRTMFKERVDKIQNFNTSIHSNLNTNENLISVKNLDSKIELSHNKLPSRNLKRMKFDNKDNDIGEREITIGLDSIFSESKDKMNISKIQNQETDLKENQKKQVSFKSETSIIWSKRRNLKSKTKENDVVSNLSHTTLQVVKEVLESRNNQSEQFEKCVQEEKEPTQNKSEIFLSPLPVIQKWSPKTNKKESRREILAKISNNHMEIIRKARESLKNEDKDNWIWEKNKTAAEIQANKILDGPSISEKYEELLKEGEPELVLPASYKLLMKYQKALDEVIIFFKNRNKVWLFEELVASVEVTTKRSFSKVIFGQILKVSPDLYTYSWKKQRGKRNLSLIVDISDENFGSLEVTEKRKKEFKENLLKLAKEHHSVFIKQLINKRPELRDFLEDFDPVQMKGWYHEFDPHSVPEIVEVEIKQERETFSRSESVSEFMKRNRSYQKSLSLTNMSLSRIKASNQDKAEPNAVSAMKISPLKLKVESSTTITTIRGVPKDLFKRIQEKEQIINREKTQRIQELEENKPKLEKEILWKLIDTIKSIYSVRRVNTLKYDKVVKQLDDSKRGIYEAESNIQARIQELCEASEKWIRIISCPRGVFIKISPNYPKKNVKIDIEMYVNRKYSKRDQRKS